VIKVVMNVGEVRILRTVGHQTVRALRDCQELETDIVPLGAVFTDTPDRILFQRRVALDRLIEVPLDLRHR
jgi:inorganic triphosphatase YgiF